MALSTNKERSEKFPYLTFKRLGGIYGINYRKSIKIVPGVRVIGGISIVNYMTNFFDKLFKRKKELLENSILQARKENREEKMNGKNSKV